MGLRGGLVLAGLLGLLPVNNEVAWSGAMAVLVALAAWLLIGSGTRRRS